MELFQGRDMLSASRPGPDRRKAMARAVLLSLAGSCSLPAHAVGLGPAQGAPILGEPLRLEVPLIGGFDRPVHDACITVRRSPEAIDADYFPRDLVGRLDTRSTPPRIILSGDAALRQPLVEFRITVTCGYNLARDYVLMTSPRSERPQAAQAAVPSAETVAAPTVVASRERQRPRVEGPVVAAPVAQAGGGLPDGLPGSTVTLDQEMTLEQLARQHFPGPLRQGRFMRWVAEANPHLFAGATNLREHRLPAGTQLVVPVGVPPRRLGDHRQGVTPLGEPMPAAPPSPAASTTTAAAPAATSVPEHSAQAAARAEAKPAHESKKDRLVVGASGGGARDMKETMVLVERLTAMMEEQISAQSANQDKIHQLESTVAEMTKTIARMEAESRRREAALQAELQALRAERLDDDARGWWQLALAVMGGGLLGVALMWIQRLYSERKRKDETSYDALLAEETPARNMPTQPPNPSEPTLGPEPAPAAPAASFTPPASPKLRASSTAPARAVAPQPQFKPTAPRTAPPPPPKPTISIPAQTSPQVTAAAAEPPLSLRLEFEPPAPTPPLRPLMEPISTEPATSPGAAAIELANIMATMGLADSAAEALETHIRENPHDSLPHWLKLLELHRASGNRTEFERAANEMRQFFNVQTDEWGQETLGGRSSIEAYPHLRTQLTRQWRQPECAAFLGSLLTDTREGTRAGFPVGVAEEILLLVALLNSED